MIFDLKIKIEKVNDAIKYKDLIRFNASLNNFNRYSDRGTCREAINCTDDEIRFSIINSIRSF